MIALVALGALVGLTACSDLLGSGREDVLVKLEATDRPTLMRIRQEALASAPTWGGVRVGEQTADVGESALEFTLPGKNLDIALGALGELDARVVSTDIDVEAPQVERAGTGDGSDGDDATPAPADIRLRVEVSEQSAGGVGALMGSLVALFAVIGVASTVRWIGGVIGSGRERRSQPRPRRIDRVDLRGDPPTQETPRIPPNW